jgi:hypothetical protein
MMKTPIGIKRSLDTLENAARADGAAAERASIVSLITAEIAAYQDGDDEIAGALVLLRRAIERGAHAQPVSEKEK